MTAYSRRQSPLRLSLIPLGLSFGPIRSGAGFVPRIRLQTPTTRECSAIRGQACSSSITPSSSYGTRGRVNIYSCTDYRDAERRSSVRLCLIISRRKTINLSLTSFFDFSDTTKQTLDGMLRSLAFQLYQGGFDSAIHLDTLS